MLRLAVPVQLLLSFWETAANEEQAPTKSSDIEDAIPSTAASIEDAGHDAVHEHGDSEEDDYQGQDEHIHVIGALAIQVASSLVSTCLTQLCMSILFL